MKGRQRSRPAVADIAAFGESARRDRLPGRSLRAIYLSKAAAIASILLLMWGLRLFVFAEVPAARYTPIILLVLLSTLAVVLGPDDGSSTLLSLSFAADIGGVTIGIHFGGGADNVSGPMLYTLIIGLTGLLLSGRAAYVAATASTVSYGAMVWAEQEQLLVHHLSYAKSVDDAIATVVSVGLYLFLAAWLVSYAAQQIRTIYRRAEALRTEAVSALSHDLKNPLGIIQNYAQMAQTATADERADFLRRIQRSAQQSLDLVHNVLDTSSPAADALVPNRTPLQLNALVAQVVELYAAEADAKGIGLTTTLATGLPDLDGDAQLLTRALGNLVSNAIKFTDHGGTVRITTAARPDAVTVAVHDSGCGIAADEHAHLFEAYSRATSGRLAPGTGLGLYIVRRIAEAHGGSVRITSALGRGSTFLLALPITEPPPAAT